MKEQTTKSSKQPIVISLLDPPQPVIIKETGKVYMIVTTKNNKAMLQDSR